MSHHEENHSDLFQNEPPLPQKSGRDVRFSEHEYRSHGIESHRRDHDNDDKYREHFDKTEGHVQSKFLEPKSDLIYSHRLNIR